MIRSAPAWRSQTATSSIRPASAGEAGQAVQEEPARERIVAHCPQQPRVIPRQVDRGNCKGPPPDCRRIVIRLQYGIKGRCFRGQRAQGKVPGQRTRESALDTSPPANRAAAVSPMGRGAAHKDTAGREGAGRGCVVRGRKRRVAVVQGLRRRARRRHRGRGRRRPGPSATRHTPGVGDGSVIATKGDGSPWRVNAAKARPTAPEPGNRSSSVSPGAGAAGAAGLAALPAGARAGDGGDRRYPGFSGSKVAYSQIRPVADASVTQAATRTPQDLRRPRRVQARTWPTSMDEQTPPRASGRDLPSRTHLR